MKNFLRRNSSTILAGLGAAGVVATSIMAVKATPKAMLLIDQAEEEKGEQLTKLETINVAGLAYVPALVTGAATIACILGSNIISKKDQATLMSAYALLDNSYKEYKKKTEELYGEEAGERIREEIAKDKYTGDGTLLDDKNELFYDFYSGRYFESTIERVLLAETEANRKMIVGGAVSLGEFYEFLGIENKPEYDLVGWSAGQTEEMYWEPWIAFEHEKILIADESDEYEGLECTIIHLPYEPFPGYLDY